MIDTVLAIKAEGMENGFALFFSEREEHFTKP
jgi:hypothetical protein